MIFQEPKVEFIKMQLDDVTTTSPGGSGAITGNCTGDQSKDDCTWPANYNY